MARQHAGDRLELLPVADGVEREVHRMHVRDGERLRTPADRVPGDERGLRQPDERLVRAQHARRSGRLGRRREHPADHAVERPRIGLRPMPAGLSEPLAQLARQRRLLEQNEIARRGERPEVLRPARIPVAMDVPGHDRKRAVRTERAGHTRQRRPGRACERHGRWPAGAGDPCAVVGRHRRASRHGKREKGGERDERDERGRGRAGRAAISHRGAPRPRP